MKKITLSQTRKQLSMYFAAIVFLIVLFLGLLFLSIRYVNEHRIDRSRFVDQSNTLLQNLGGEIDILSLFGLEEERFDEDFIDKKGRNRAPVQLSYLVLDNENAIVQRRILQDINFEIISGKFETGFGNDDGVLFRKEYLDNSLSGDKAIIYMKHKLSFDDYLEDVLWYFILSLLFGLGFYYIGLLFVGKILKPVADNMDDMQNFIHNAGHELKTPIAVIDSNLQLLSRTKKPDKQLVGESRDEVKRLNSLVEGLVDLADISSTAKTKKIDIEPEIHTIIGEYSSQIDKKKIQVLVEFKKKLIVTANQGYMQMFLSNLIENAVKYNKKSGDLRITYNGDILSISDTGVGMNTQDTEKIFDRFYRTDSVRTGEGFGIGLSLVKKIADTYNWNISVDSRLGKGTQFDIEF